MRRALALVALVALPASAAAQDRSEEIAAALEQDPVYVAPARAQRLDVQARGTLRLRIARKDNGRIKIAVIPASWARAEGGVRDVANAIDAELEPRGALLVVADADAHVVTSHRHATEAARGVQQAFNAGGSLEDKLRRTVDALTEADPGPTGDLRPAGSGDELGTSVPEVVPRDPFKIVDTIDHGIRMTFMVFIGIALAVFALAAFLVLRSVRRASTEIEESIEDARVSAEAERVKLGEDIVDLDVATSMPNVAPAARTAYERALDAYEKSEPALEQADSPRRVQAAAALIAGGRADAARAREATGSSG